MADNNGTSGFITEKLYSPLEFYLHDPRGEQENGEYGAYDLYDERYRISHEEAFGYMDAIELAVRPDRGRSDPVSGLAEYVPDSLSDIVVSVIPDIEVQEGRLWCAADIRLSRPITPGEMAELTQWWSGQLSDGWGEGFEQREIKVSGGELYIVPWSSDGSFFIDATREFERRLGIGAPLVERSAPAPETPAQAELDEPDVYGGEAADTLREQLLQRLDANLTEYIGREVNSPKNSVPNMSNEIAAYAGAHYYLSEIHSFHASELEYLLKFQNPLSIVADRFQIAGMDDYSDVMWDIFDKQDALQESRYAPMPETPAPEGLEPEERLRARLDENFSEYKKAMLSLSKDELFNAASETASTRQAYTYFTEEHNFTDAEVSFLLKFQNPLDVVSDRFGAQLFDVSATISRIFEDQQRTLRQGGYALMPEEPASAAAELSDKSAEKPSVLERIRKAREESKNNSAPRKAGPGKDRGPEL
jgi:hypothetical protein